PDRSPSSSPLPSGERGRGEELAFFAPPLTGATRRQESEVGRELEDQSSRAGGAQPAPGRQACLPLPAAAARQERAVRRGIPRQGPGNCRDDPGRGRGPTGGNVLRGWDRLAAVCALPPLPPRGRPGHYRGHQPVAGPRVCAPDVPGPGTAPGGLADRLRADPGELRRRYEVAARATGLADLLRLLRIEHHCPP